MPVFYFHTTGTYAHRDDEGFEFASDAQACDQALVSTGELLKESRTVDGHFDLTLEVANAQHKLIFRLKVIGRAL